MVVPRMILSLIFITPTCAIVEMPKKLVLVAPMEILDNRLLLILKVADGDALDNSTQSMPINEEIPTVKLLVMVIVLLLISAVKTPDGNPLE